jgi:hypothetical protein
MCHKSNDMKDCSATTIVRRVLEKSPTFCQIEIEAQAALAAYSSETNPKSERRELLLRTLAHNPARVVIEPPIFPMNRRLHSSLAVAVFERELLVSSPCGFGVSAPVAPQHSAPASSAKASRKPIIDLLPHENEHSKSSCFLSREGLQRRRKVDRKPGNGKLRICHLSLGF